LAHYGSFSDGIYILKNIPKNTVAIDGAPKKIIILDVTGCNPQK
jgi:hypothetical protein